MTVSNDLLEWRRARQWPVVPCDEEIFLFGCVRTRDGFVAMTYAEGEPYSHSKDLYTWRKGASAVFDQPGVDMVSKPFFFKGKWNVLYERKNRVYRAVLGGVPDKANND